MSDEILELKLIGLKTTGPLSSIISLQRQLKLEPKKSNTLVSGNAGDEKSHDPGGRRKISFYQFN